MQFLHQKLLTSSGLYAAWHDHPKHPIIHWAAFLAFAFGSFFYVAGQVNSFRQFSISNLESAGYQMFRIAAAPTSGLVGYWNLDEGPGTTAADSSGSGNTGTLTNGPTWTTGKVGSGALSFDGVNDGVNLGTPNSLNITGAVTVSAWINYRTASLHEAIAVHADGGADFGGQQYMLTMRSSTAVGFAVNNGTALLISSNGTVSPNTWYHVVGTYNGVDTTKLYINGVQTDSDISAGFGALNNIPTQKIGIGAAIQNNRGYLDGLLDEVRVYNRALSASEVTELYNYTGGTPPPPDTTAPVISSVAASTITSSGATITWTTDESSDTQVEYGTTTAYGSSTTLNTTLVTSHSQALSGLVANTLYNYRVKSRDAAGNLANSSNQTFTTLATTPSPTPTPTPGTTSSISQYGITWYFDKAYSYGQFANGDYWVLGPVTITSITPEFNGTHNGWEVNPVASSKQGFDAGSGYGGFDASRIPSLPYLASPGQSIIKGLSYIQDPSNTLNCYNNPPDGVSCLETAAVLTIVGAVPPDNGATVFRPPYIGTQKPYYSINDLQTGLLPTLAQVGTNIPSLATVESRTKRVQVEHIRGAEARTIRPALNLPDYGGTIGVWNGEAALRFMLNDSVQAKMPALIAFVQGGIDRYHAVLNGQTWPAGPGHEPGQKISIAFAAVLLNNANMKSTVSSSKFFSEDLRIQPGYNGQPVFGEAGATSGQYWNFVYTDPGYNTEWADIYNFIDGGMNAIRTQAYQTGILGPTWKMSALTAMLMPEISSIWNSPKFFTYIERFVNIGLWSQPDPCAPVLQGGGPNGVGVCVLDPDLTPGSTMQSFSCQAGKECGRFPQYHGTLADNNNASGPYNSVFGYNMWNAYRSTVGSDTAAPSTPTGLTATAASSQINLSWTASTDNVGVTGYKIFRGGVQVGISVTTNYSDTGLTASTLYTYTVSAYDAANNNSAQSSAASATTQAASTDCSSAAVRCVPSEYLTIQACANAAVAGDTCRVAAGVYSEHVVTKIGGISEDQRIVFKADGAATMQGFDVKHPYVTVDGFDITGYTTMYQGHITITSGGSYCRILNNTIRDGASNVQGIYFALSMEAANCVVSGNTLSNLNYVFLGTSGWGHLFENNVFEYQNSQDYVRLFGANHVFRRNIFKLGIPKEGVGNHPDFVQTFGVSILESRNHLFEENWIENLENGQLSQLDSGDGLVSKGILYDNVHTITFRRNVFINIAYNANVGMPSVRFEHNTFYRLAYQLGGFGYGGSLTRGDASYGLLKNNVFLEGGAVPDVWGGRGFYSLFGATFGKEVITVFVTKETLGSDPIAAGIFSDLMSNGYVDGNGNLSAKAKALTDISQFVLADAYASYKQSVYDNLVKTILLNKSIRDTFLADYNFVAGAASAGFPAKSSSGCVPTETATVFNFCEVHGINGGDPKFVNLADLDGADNIPFTLDDGIKPRPDSILCGKGEAGTDIGALSCDPAKIFSGSSAVPVPPSDLTPPTVSISSPASGATVAGTITVSANASDNVAVSGVQFKLDGANLGTEDTTSPYSVSWDTTTAT